MHAAVAVALALTLTILFLLFLRSRRPRAALVISLSPANQSPRAVAHATSISHHAATTLLAHPPFPPPTTFSHHPLSTPPRPASLPRKLLTHTLALLRALLRFAPQNLSTIIINTPPALPALPLLLLLARPLFPSATLVVDWHNLAYTLMPRSSRLTPLATFLERRCATLASVHWTVSHAMAHFLEARFAIHPTVVYDTPRAPFLAAARALTPARTKQLLTRVSRLATRMGASHSPHDTPIVVTSTSWTPDEDFGALHRALLAIDRATPPLIVVITGRGPLREAFEKRFRASSWSNVAVWTAWLPVEDYPLLLASATLGLSLHASSSGLDLPMKAVDMLACGLPVVALRYRCIHELVNHGVNGVLFDDADQLAVVLRRLLEQSPEEIARLRQGARDSFAEGMEWEAYWRRTALPTIPLPKVPRPTVASVS